MRIIIGIDHGYYAIKTAHACFPTGLVAYEYEPYTLQNVLQYAGKYYVCGTGRQTLVKDKTANDNYYLLTMAAVAQELKHRKAEKCVEVVLAAGLPLAGFGREKKNFREYLFRREQPIRFLFENEAYEVLVRDVKLFPQGYSALALYPEHLTGEPSVLLADIGGWTVDLMRLDNAIPNASTCRSLELGVIRCMDEIMEQVRRNTGLSVTDMQVERVLMVLCQEKVQVKSELFLQYSILLILLIFPSSSIPVHTHFHIHLVIEIHNDYGFSPCCKMSLYIQTPAYVLAHNLLF